MIVSEKRSKSLAVFKKSQTAIIGLVLVLILIFTAVFANVLSPHDPVKQNRKDSSIIKRTQNKSQLK